MDWIELHLCIPQHALARAEEALLAGGALAVTLRDAGDEPVLEPQPGQMPLWSQLQVTALLDASSDPQAMLDALATALAGESYDQRLTTLGDRAWEREWLAHFGPLRFGQRLWVSPPGFDPGDSGDTIVWLDPGLAFGTGTHPTTALCLTYLAQHPPHAAQVIDYGCGSGILAIAALRLGAARADAVDIDPQALQATRANASRNQVAERLHTHASADGLPGSADLLIANIVAGPLLELADRLATLVRSGGHLVLSGLLPDQAPAVAARYACHFDVDTIAEQDGWCLITGQRH